jgi:2-iminobutanoate/2-iminopropanoate deaminase
MKHLKPIRAEGLPEPISHYTDAVLAGKTLYISGLIATDAHGHVVGKSDVVEQTRQIFRNLDLVLKSAGASPQDVVKVTIFMRDVTQRPDINPVRQEFFGGHRPASTLVEVSRLVNDDLLLEIEAVAVLP